MGINEIERAAASGKEMPDAIASPEQAAYISFRGLYHDWHAGIVTKEQAAREKKKILAEYDNLSQMRNMFQDSLCRWNRAELYMADAEKNGNAVESARKVIKILDGREGINQE